MKVAQTLETIEHARLLPLKIAGVAFDYGTQPVLQGIDLEVPAGDFLVLSGPNGGGKSTLIRLAMGLLQPSKGSISLWGRKPPVRNPVAGYVPQQNNDIALPATVREFILAGRAPLRGLGRRFSAADRAAADMAMEAVGLDKLSQRLINNISGGERRRAQLGRALAAQPEILFLDEPTSGIDEASREILFKKLSALNRAGTTVVVVSHEVTSMTSMAKTFAFINRRIFFHGPKGAWKEFQGG